MVSVAIALAFVPLVLALVLRYRYHLVLLYRAGAAALRERLSGVPRELRTFRYLLSNARPGDPQSVLSTFDRWGHSGEPLRCLGPTKGRLVERLVLERGPRRVLELGTHLGYGAVLVARVLPPGGRLWTIEGNPERARVAEKVLRLAGIDETKVELVLGRWEVVLPVLARSRCLAQADLVLLAHGPRRYLPALRLLEALGLLAPGATLLADRALAPAAPRFLRYARTSGRYRYRLHRTGREYCPGVPDGIAELRCNPTPPPRPETPPGKGGGGMGGDEGEMGAGMGGK